MLVPPVIGIFHFDRHHIFSIPAMNHSATLIKLIFYRHFNALFIFFPTNIVLANDAIRTYDIINHILCRGLINVAISVTDNIPVFIEGYSMPVSRYTFHASIQPITLHGCKLQTISLFHSRFFFLGKSTT